MDKKVFLENFKEILQSEKQIDFETQLSDIEQWDSISITSVMLWIDSSLGIRLKIADMLNIKTVKDLAILAKIAV